MNLAFEVSLFIHQNYILHAVKSYDMGPTDLLPLRRKACCGFLSPLKICCVLLGLNPPTLDPMASTLTITPAGKFWGNLMISIAFFHVDF
jgi:hypothetical protein